MNFRFQAASVAACILLMGTERVIAQTSAAPPLRLVQATGQAAPPAVITLQDALERARSLDAQVRAAEAEIRLAREDRTQARASLLPVVSHTTEYLGTQGNGVTPSGRFVTNDGVHLYRSWAVVRSDITPSTFLKTETQRAEAGEALANARLEIMRRGLTVTVTKSYYDLVAAQRAYASTQQAVQQAQNFLDLTKTQESLGQVAHSDVVKADIQVQLQTQSLQDAQLGMENARVALAVILFPTLNENFTVVDTLDSAPVLPLFADAQRMAESENPDLRAANELVRQAGLDVRIAKNAFLPSLSIEAIYGIEANALKLHSTVAADPEAGMLPNLGYFITASLHVPIFNWGATSSKVRQAETRKSQAQVELSQMQRQLVGALQTSYNEALAARTAVDNTRHTVDLAAESLRLINLRYQAGESPALEVVDAQNTLVQARTAYDRAQTRYRVAIAILQTLTGTF